ncbi:MAG: hypothetical protein AB1705_08945 [Verrucomicrobiota bacterium]
MDRQVASATNIPPGFEPFAPKPYPAFVNSGEVYWHKLGKASLDLSRLEGATTDGTAIFLPPPAVEWFHPIQQDERFDEIKWYEDPNGKRIPPNHFGHPDFRQAFPGYPDIPVVGQGDELGETFTETADVAVMRIGERGVEVLLFQRPSGYYALPGGIVLQTVKGKGYEIDDQGVYRQLKSAHEKAAVTARRSLLRKAGIDLPEKRFNTEVYQSVLDDIRNSSGAAMYAHVFCILDTSGEIPDPDPELLGHDARFFTLAELVDEFGEPTLPSLWGCHAFLLQNVLWYGFVVNPENFARLYETDKELIKEVLSYHPFTHLLDDEVTSAAQDHWASQQWGRRLPWYVRGNIESPRRGGGVLPGMTGKQGHRSLVPAWIMRKACRFPGYNVEHLIQDLDFHKSAHADIPRETDFSYLITLKHADPKLITEWLAYLGREALEANKVWVSRAESVLGQLNIDRTRLGELRLGDAKLNQLLELKRQMKFVEGAQTFAQLRQALAENQQVFDFMVRAHAGWREHTYGLPDGSVTKDPHSPGVDKNLVPTFIERLRRDISRFIDAANHPADPANRRPKNLQQILTVEIPRWRKKLEMSPSTSAAQTFGLMLDMGHLMEEFTGPGLTEDTRQFLSNQIADLLYVIKMDANSAVITGILNAARKQGARLEQELPKPELCR